MKSWQRAFAGILHPVPRPLSSAVGAAGTFGNRIVLVCQALAPGFEDLVLWQRQSGGNGVLPKAAVRMGWRAAVPSRNETSV